jgi:hypothetical protein
MTHKHIAATAVAIVAALAGASASIAGAPEPAPGQLLRLTASSDERGWVTLTAAGADATTVEVAEQIGERRRTIASLSPRGAVAELRRAARWSCERRERRFVATAAGPGGAVDSATASIATPSCARRLRATVVPAQVPPGGVAAVRIADTWGFGGVSTIVCARAPARARSAPRRSCRRLRLAPGSPTRRARVRLARRGRWTITAGGLGSARPTFARGVQVTERPRLRVLVTGDSMIFGLYEALGRDLRGRALVKGDPHPGRGLTTPRFLDWPAHARRSARTWHPDVTIVLVGAADAGYPLPAPGGDMVACCEPGWVAAYGRRVRGMMRSYIRAGHGAVYWVLLPAPRSPVKANVIAAENAGVREAASGLGDGATVIDRVADVLSPGARYADSIIVGASRRVVRAEDGVHLAAPGIRIAADILTGTLRRDGLLP